MKYYIPVKGENGVYDALTGEYIAETIEEIERDDLLDSIHDDLERYVKGERGL